MTKKLTEAREISTLLTEAIKEVIYFYGSDTGLIIFDKFSDEDKEDLVIKYIIEELGSDAYEVLEAIDPKDFEPYMRSEPSRENGYAEIGKIVVNSMVDHCRESVQELINEERREIL